MGRLCVQTAISAIIINEMLGNDLSKLGQMLWKTNNLENARSAIRGKSTPQTTILNRSMHPSFKKLIWDQILRTIQWQSLRRKWKMMLSSKMTKRSIYRRDHRKYQIRAFSLSKCQSSPSAVLKPLKLNYHAKILWLKCKRKTMRASYLTERLIF